MHFHLATKKILLHVYQSTLVPFFGNFTSICIQFLISKNLKNLIKDLNKVKRTQKPKIAQIFELPLIAYLTSKLIMREA